MHIALALESWERDTAHYVSCLAHYITNSARRAAPDRRMTSVVKRHILPPIWFMAQCPKIMTLIKSLLCVFAVILPVSLMGVALPILQQFWKVIEPYVKGYAYFIVVYATLATVYATVASVYVVVCKTKGKHGEQTRMKLHEVSDCRQIDYCERHPLPGKHV